MKSKLFAFIIVFLLAGCGAGKDTLKIGSKSFVENAILAQIVSQLVTAKTGLDIAIVDCDNSADCARALRMNRIQLMVDYSGTGLIYSGVSTKTKSGTLETVRELYRPWGLLWLDPLGYDNGFKLVIPSDRALSLEISSISDLSKLEDGIRIAVPGVYLRRPGDGLHALLRHYGLKLKEDPLIIDDLGDRLRQLSRGRADVAIFNATDGVLRRLAVKALVDDRDFFPKYEAAVVSRKDALDKHPKLEQALALLHGKITTDEMMDLNYRVQVQGWSPEAVAYRFLQDHKLSPDSPKALKRKPEIAVAVDPNDELGPIATLAIQAVHRVFLNQPVNLRKTNRPVEDLTQGKARLAVLTADRFFRGTGLDLDRFAIRDEGIEAAAQLAPLYLHIVRRKGERAPESVFDGRIGISPLGSGSERTSEAILDLVGKRPTVYTHLAKLLNQLADKQLDVILIFTFMKNPDIAKALSERKLILHPMPEIQKDLPIFLRKARIPEGTYVSQENPVESLSMQVVLAGAAPSRARALTSGGPSGAVPFRRIPLTFEQANALAEAINIVEPPDPVLPAVWMRSKPTIEQPTESSLVIDTVLNIMVVIFIGWVVFLVVRGSET